MGVWVRIRGEGTAVSVGGVVEAGLIAFNGGVEGIVAHELVVIELHTTDELDTIDCGVSVVGVDFECSEYFSRAFLSLMT